ncbi:hypothetical protein PhCBS80983_g03548 [Powellomyces hirtus]|uniref:Transcriptional regulator n=1 Tax=Powellomyces hirtus TaxID=109895 RepID=A0A507E3Z9_9FUNG|nr:hypothetical protein PhCBS80983_g03548 [Powellomyces hirtus]
MVICEHIEKNSFGLLTALLPGDSVPTAVHLPFLVAQTAVDAQDTATFLLETHLAAANPLAKLPEDHPVLVVFAGPHAYISPSSYSDETKSVPTWNYTSVHVQGRLKRVSSTSQSAGAFMRRLIAKYDPDWVPVHDDVVSPRYKDAMMKGIVVWNIIVNKVEAQWKLSQNKSAAEVNAIAARLREGGNPDVAALMVDHTMR